ncbi:hypothetical protein KOR34_39870 [Posidoniimonas corsicana]|uniref:DUF3124 domain-containing protein n=1 Tax=Posidoniimonas corsicana TaxID=1938618 RepID=A0A5C5V3C9_9BACT|nr:DUF3124 domain-containing protein [Posidoniimonas corsicana]TWT32225.1 hypothetical protein KOR34_39870 [Posidoniimonas corsicana]
MAQLTEKDAEDFMRRFKLLIIGGGVLLAAVLLGGLLYMDSRLEAVRDALRFRQPSAVGEGPGDAITIEANHTTLNAAAGQTLYAPAYSHVYHQDGRSYLLTVTLSVRNTDPDGQIVVTSARYYDTDGKLLKNHLEKPLRLGPLATAEFLVERDDKSGGSGANFLVEWVAEQPVSPPMVQTVMIDTRGQQGISFACDARVIKEVTPNADGATTDAPPQG